MRAKVAYLRAQPRLMPYDWFEPIERDYRSILYLPTKTIARRANAADLGADPDLDFSLDVLSGAACTLYIVTKLGRTS